MATPCGRVESIRAAAERIALAAIEVVAVHGVEGLTHRRVAAAAGVPLGRRPTTTRRSTTCSPPASRPRPPRARPKPSSLGRKPSRARPGRRLDRADRGGMRSSGSASRVSYELYVPPCDVRGCARSAPSGRGCSPSIYRQYTKRLTADALSAAVDGLWIDASSATNPVADGRSSACCAGSSELAATAARHATAELTVVDR